MEFSNTYVKIDLDAISENFRNICKKAGAPVMAVVKANAYGHGAVQVARLLAHDAAFFGVSSTAEALELRRAGIENPILILGHTPPENFPMIIENDIRVAIFRYEDALALSQTAVACGKTALFHFALDTGMSRIGFQPTQEDADICAKIAQLPGIVSEGLFSHFATADSVDLTRTKAQAERYADFDKMLRARGVQIKLRHLDNSAGIMNFGCHYDMVRAGIVLYGLYPSDEVDQTLLALKPAMSWHSCVSYVKPLQPGRQVSYGGTFEVTSPMLVATVPAGYADGYRRNLSNRFYVLIKGKKAPILGRVCMDQFMVDVTDIEGVQPGDPVVLFGTDAGAKIPVEEIAAASDSFNYEFVCGVNRRVPRHFYIGGKCVEKADYLLD